MQKILKKLLSVFKGKDSGKLSAETIFINNGKIPWSKGYHRYKRKLIREAINNDHVLQSFRNQVLDSDFGHRIDERVVEYPWIFSNLSKGNENILDAGSTFNFQFVVNHPIIEAKDLTIFTFAPEENNFAHKGITYEYGDLRAMPFEDAHFDTIVSQSTIEHIDMDNSIYGYDISHNEDDTKKSYSYMSAISEMLRTLKPNGTLLLTFPYGKFENHGFFQQFDEEMLNRILAELQIAGTFTTTFFRYHDKGWQFAEQEELKEVISFNPHTGKGKLDDHAAHCRSVVCIKFTKAKK